MELALLGNDRLKENLRASVDSGRISHFYLISGPAGSGKKTLARHLAASILCRGQQKPCGQCAACRKVLSDNHPDLITVTDPEHKAVAVKIVRDVRDQMFVRPNEGERKIYLFAQELGVEGQNALLKILEEPPSYGVFILLTNNPETLLPTVRSRCTELVLHSLPENLLLEQLRRDFPEADPETLQAAAVRSGGYLGQAREILEEGSSLAPQTESFVRAFCSRDPVGLAETLAPMEKWERDRFLDVINQWLQTLQSALIYRSGGLATWPGAQQLSAARSARELKEAIDLLQKTVAYAQSNVSVAALCGHLAWQLR